MAGEQNRERFERIIGRGLAAGRVGGDAQCPDASIIAAYRERSLPPEERTQCERHLAQCASCAGALAALARIDDALRPGNFARPQTAREDGRGWWRLRGPLSIATFGAAAAILIVVALKTFTTQPGLCDRERRSDLQAKSLASNAAPVTAKPKDDTASGGSHSLMAMNEAARAKPEPPQLQKSPELLRKSHDAGKAVARPQAAGSLAREQARMLSGDELKESDELKEKEGRNRESDQLKAESAGAPMGAVATAEAPAPPSAAPGAPVATPAPSAAAPDFAASAPTPPPPPAPLVAAGTSSAGAAASSAAPAVAGEVSAASRIGAGAVLGAGPVTGRTSAARAGGVAGPIPAGNQIAVETSDHTATVVWVVGARGAISRNNPATGWIPQTSGVTTDLTGGSAPSTTTCWVVGRSGTILRTIDGERWTKVIAPVSDDLTGVVAAGATEATISAVSGRRFATSDGGVTWRPLQ